MSTPNRVPEGVPTGGQFAASAKTEANVSLIRDPNLAHVRLAEPEVTASNGCTITNYTGAPIETHEGLTGYGGVAAGRSTWVDDEFGVPGQAYGYTGGPSGKNGWPLMHVSGYARSHAEAWDRISHAEYEWALKYDHRPDTLATIAARAEQGKVGFIDSDETMLRRITAADALNDAVEARKALPVAALSPRKRRAIRDADAGLQTAWTTYCEQYPEARSHMMVST